MARSSIESPTRNTRRNAIIVSKSNSGSFYNFDSVSLQLIPNWSISTHSEYSNKDSPRRNQRSIEKLFRSASNSFGRREIKRASRKIFETRSSRDLQLTYIRSRLHIDPRNTCIWRFFLFFVFLFAIPRSDQEIGTKTGLYRPILPQGTTVSGGRAANSSAGNFSSGTMRAIVSKLFAWTAWTGGDLRNTKDY